MTSADPSPRTLRRAGWRRDNFDRRILSADGRLIAPGRAGLHGTWTTYVDYGCRCVECSPANARHRDGLLRGVPYNAYRARWRQLNASERILSPSGRLIHPDRVGKHGMLTTYTDYGCRCEDCSVVAAERTARNRQKRRDKAVAEAMGVL